MNFINKMDLIKNNESKQKNQKQKKINRPSYKKLYLELLNENKLAIEKIEILEKEKQELLKTNNQLNELVNKFSIININENENYKSINVSNEIINVEENEVVKCKKGRNCSINGNLYEKTIYNIVKNCYINDKQFNTQDENELGGSKSDSDIICNYKSDKDTDIEIKKYNSPDWMQCSLHP
jgi:hypothetical protein